MQHYQICMCLQEWSMTTPRSVIVWDPRLSSLICTLFQTTFPFSTACYCSSLHNGRWNLVALFSKQPVLRKKVANELSGSKSSGEIGDKSWTACLPKFTLRHFAEWTTELGGCTHAALSCPDRQIMTAKPAFWASVVPQGPRDRDLDDGSWNDWFHCLWVLSSSVHTTSCIGYQWNVACCRSFTLKNRDHTCHGGHICGVLWSTWRPWLAGWKRSLVATLNYIQANYGGPNTYLSLDIKVV